MTRDAELLPRQSAARLARQSATGLGRLAAARLAQLARQSAAGPGRRGAGKRPSGPKTPPVRHVPGKLVAVWREVPG